MKNMMKELQIASDTGDADSRLSRSERRLSTDTCKPRQPTLRMRWLSVALLLLLCLVGCGGASTAQHDDDEEHHHIPPHRPRDLAAAVVQLEERPAALLKVIDSKDGNVETLFSELRDIVRWVPEIAADSDMKKQPWDEVHAAAQKLEELLPQSAAAFSELKAGSTQEAEWRRLVGRLKQLAPIEARKNEPEM